MSGNQFQPNRELHYEIEQFLYREARLLDERQFQQWLELVTDDISYTMPSRHSPLLDPSQRETEALQNVAQELSSGVEAPLRSENYLTLSVRVMRAFKINSWTDNPPARTSRFVSNVEVQEGQEEGAYRVFSNIMIHYSRHQQDNHLFAARRRDVLRREGDALALASREVIVDWNVVTVPSVGIFF